MQRLRVPILLFWALLLASPAGAEDSVRFELCGGVDSVEVGEFGTPPAFAVMIQLERQAGERFATLTRENVGKTLDITHAGHSILRAKIQAEIRSGVVSATYAERADAERARTTLADPAVCAGAGSPSGPG